MLLFRSEEHIERWRRTWGQPRGAAVPVEQLWPLAAAWYGPDRRDPAWRRRTPAEAEALFGSLGLSGDFWRLSR